LFILPSTDVSFGPNFGKAFFTQFIGSSWLRDCNWVISRHLLDIFYLSVEKRKKVNKRRWNGYHGTVSYSRASLNPFSPWNRTYDQHWQAVALGLLIGAGNGRGLECYFIVTEQVWGIFFPGSYLWSFCGCLYPSAQGHCFS
jgi:hypothetical protein